MLPCSEARSEAASDDGVPLAARRAVADGDIEAGATQARTAADAYKARRCTAEARHDDASEASLPAQAEPTPVLLECDIQSFHRVCKQTCAALGRALCAELPPCSPQRPRGTTRPRF